MRKWKILIIALILGSCTIGTKQSKDINCKYQGGIIFEKRISTYDGTCYYSIKYEGDIIHRYAYEIDSDYEVGDTINKPCLGETDD